LTLKIESNRLFFFWEAKPKAEEEAKLHTYIHVLINWEETKDEVKI
jgi:hypothetical protein